MKTEVYINGLLIDLVKDEPIVASYGNITFGELNKRKGIKSNTFNAPFSQRNKIVSESSELVNSDSLIPYRNNTIRIEVDGVPVFEGLCKFEESEEHYQIQSFAGASDFYSQITNKKLTELDLSAYSHIWGESAIRNSWTATDGYVYAWVNYGKDGMKSYGYPINPNNLKVTPDYLLPQIFFHTAIKQIAIDCGYTLYGDVLNNARFLSHVIIPNKFPVPIMYGGTFNLSLLLPDLTQGKLWLDFANIYGLQFDVNDINKTIYANYIDDIIFNEPENWNDKVDNSQKPKTSYRIDTLGTISYLKFKTDSEVDYKTCNQDYGKAIPVDDTTLIPEADIYTSEFYLIQNDIYPITDIPRTKTFFIKNNWIYTGIWDSSYDYFGENLIVWRNGTYFKAVQPSLNIIPGTDTDYWQAMVESDIWEIKSRPMYGVLAVDIDSPLVVQFPTPIPMNRIIKADGLDWPTSYAAHYLVFDRIIKRTKVVDRLIKLSNADINQLDFTRAKIIDDELYVLEGVSQFKLNENDSTICNLIRL